MEQLPNTGTCISRESLCLGNEFILETSSLESQHPMNSNVANSLLKVKNALKSLYIVEDVDTFANRPLCLCSVSLIRTLGSGLKNSI